VGTQVFHREKLVADLSQPGARWVAARGGHGGKGNAFFRSATNQAPDYAQPGQEGDSYEFTLVLKSVADIGLVGYPNVGKSSLISRVSQARPKIADYPFTTIQPNLGVAMLDGGRRLVIADIPGLITGAHEGRGLGTRFLRHIERTSVLAQLIDIGVTVDGELTSSVFEEDSEVRAAVESQFNAIDHELRSFSNSVAELPRVVVFSKGDTALAQRAFSLTKDRFEERKLPAFLVSSVTGEGLQELLEELHKTVLKQKNLVS
jgi:GTP-binding protein